MPQGATLDHTQSSMPAELGMWFSQGLYVLCATLVLTGVYMAYHSLALQSSVQGLFNSILVFLSGVLLFLFASHEGVVSRKLNAMVSIPRN